MATERRALLSVIRSALDTNTLPAIRTAQDQLRQWVSKHPEDYMMRDAGEPLALTEDARLAIEQEQGTLKK